LRNLGALPQGQAPDAETYQSVSDLADGMVDELEKRDVVYLPTLTHFEDYLLQPLGHILAWRAAAEFGAANDQALAALATQAELHLRNMESGRPTYKIAPGQYF
jgi:hypothetical protein